LEIEANTSIKALNKALLNRGFDVTRTPSEWIPSDADDETQLLGATIHERCIFTFNIHDFMLLAQQHPRHNGIILAAQKSWRVSELIEALTLLLFETKSTDWHGQVRWLNEWRNR